MNLAETGEVTTPLDDPCQYNPAWRSIVAGYLFSLGVRSDKDLKSISVTGCLEVEDTPIQEEDGGEKPAKRPKKRGPKPKKGKDVHKKKHVPVEPFHSKAEYRVFANDKWIAGYISMCDESVYGSALSECSVPYRLAERWYTEADSESIMRKRLEPLLLTDIGMDIITLDLIGLTGVQPAIEAYEKLYFNCREDDFSLSRPAQLISRFAMPYGPLKMYLRKWEELDDEGFCIQDGKPIAKDSDVWRAIAATMGYDALVYSWGWADRAHGVKGKTLADMITTSWKAAVGRMISDLYSGNISHEDASRVLASYTSQLKYISDEKSGGGAGGANDTTKALMDILYLAAPKMVQFDAEEDASRNEEIQSRIKSQLAISKQSIEDHGKQVEADIIDAQISEAVEQ